MTDTRLIFTTTGNREEAQKLARALVERKLAACVNIVPHIESVYRWQGAVDTATESLLVVKTTAANASAVSTAIRELHTYELPEVVELAIEGGSPGYLDWIRESVTPA